MHAHATTTDHAPDFEVGIIGAGVSGLGVARELAVAGIEDFVIFERADDIGGTWRDNTYPGVAVDIPCYAYQFSYFKNPNWSHLYAPGSEVKQYLDDFADHFGLRPHLRLGTDIRSRTWDEDLHVWRLGMADGTEVTVRWCVGAIGAFCEPQTPDFPGIDDFDGRIMHTARWDHDLDLTGKRVAVIGTGASSLQLIPEVAKVTAQLDVYQRTPIWVGLKKDPEFSDRHKARLASSERYSRAIYKATSWVVEQSVINMTVRYAKAPWVTTFLRRLVEKHHRTQVGDDAELFDKLTPDFQYACKRPSFSNEYLPTMQRDDVELVTDPIARFTPAGIVTEDGTERPVDVVITATGFVGSFDPRLYRERPVTGRDGLDLADFWESERMSAYHGISTPGIPNHFHVFGPYAGIAGTFHPLVEVGGRHVVNVIEEARRRGATCVDVRREPHRAYHEDMLARMRDALWYNEPTCRDSNTYYYSTHGDVLLLRPVKTKEARALAEDLPFEDYTWERLGTTSAAAAERRAVAGATRGD